MSIDGATKQYVVCRMMVLHNSMLYVDWWCYKTVCCMSIDGAT